MTEFLRWRHAGVFAISVLFGKDDTFYFSSLGLISDKGKYSSVIALASANKRRRDMFHKWRSLFQRESLSQDIGDVCWNYPHHLLAVWWNVRGQFTNHIIYSLNARIYHILVSLASTFRYSRWHLFNHQLASLSHIRMFNEHRFEQQGQAPVAISTTNNDRTLHQLLIYFVANQSSCGISW